MPGGRQAVSSSDIQQSSRNAPQSSNAPKACGRRQHNRQRAHARLRWLLLRRDGNSPCAESASNTAVDIEKIKAAKKAWDDAGGKTGRKFIRHPAEFEERAAKFEEPGGGGAGTTGDRR